MENLTITQLVDFLVSQEQIQVDKIGPIEILKENWIFDTRCLSRVPVPMLSRLELPLYLEVLMTDYVQSHSNPTKNKDITHEPRTRPLVRADSDYLPSSTHLRPKAFSTLHPKKHRRKSSSMASLSHPQRQKSRDGVSELDACMQRHIRETWSIISASNSDKNTLINFYDQFYRNWCAIDPYMNEIFKASTLVRRSFVMMQVMKTIIDRIENRAVYKSDLQKLSVHYLIMGIKSESYKSFGEALHKTFDNVLGHDVITPEVHLAWNNLLQLTTRSILVQYEKILKGWTGIIKVRIKNRWKLRYSNMTHQKITLFRDSGLFKCDEEIGLSSIQSIEPIEDGNILDPAEQEKGICLVGHTDRLYLCCLDSQDSQFWKEQLNVRIKAFERLNETIGMVQTDDKENKAFAKEGKLIKKLDRIRRRFS